MRFLYTTLAAIVSPLLVVAADVSGVQAQSTPAAATPVAEGYAGEVLSTPGLGSYWRLDEPSGAVARDLGDDGIEGAYASSVGLGAPGLIANDPDPAIVVNGVSDSYVDMGDQFDFTGFNPFSLEVWIKPAAFQAAYPRVIQKEGSDVGGRQGYLIYINKENGRIGFERWRDGQPDVLISPDALPMNETAHLVATYDGATMRLYVNGQAVAEGAAIRELADNPFVFRLGARGDGASAFAGEIDEAAVYNVALDAETVASHYAAGTSGAVIEEPQTVEAASPTAQSEAPAPPTLIPAATLVPASSPTPETPATVAPTVVPELEPTIAAEPTVATESPPEETPAPATDEVISTAVTTVDLNFRAGPSPDTEIITIIPAGTTVTLTGKVVDGFASARYDEQAGWLSSDFLDFGVPPAP